MLPDHDITCGRFFVRRTDIYILYLIPQWTQYNDTKYDTEADLNSLTKTTKTDAYINYNSAHFKVLRIKTYNIFPYF